MREGWDTCRTLHGLSRALQRLLPHGAECVYEREREGEGERERENVCVSVAKGGDPTPPPLDCASLTGWRGRWGHCNKANTHTHTFSTAVMSSFLSLFPASTLPSFQDLLSASFPRRLALIPLASCFPLNFSLSARFLDSPPTFHLAPLPTPCNPIPSSLTVR